MRKIRSVRSRRRARNVIMPPTLRYKATSSSHNRGNKRASSRLRMRPWLEGLLDREECSILHWEDRGMKTFTIAWRHASSHGFDPSQHGDLFYMWAHHTGKLTNNSHGNHSNNKSTFRCALHSLKDCIELTKKGDKRGEGAKRTYQFIDSDHDLYDTKKKNAFKKRNNKVQQLVDENSGSSHEFSSSSMQELDDLSTETYLPSNNLTPLLPVAHIIQESTIPHSVGSDIKVPISLSSSSMTPSSITTDTSESFCHSLVIDVVDQEQYFNFQSFETAEHESSETYSDAASNENYSSTFLSVNYDDNNTCDYIGFKEEPVTPDNVCEDTNSIDQDAYESTTVILIPKLSCGGNVKVKKNVEENQLERIDFSLIQAFLDQQVFKIPRIIPQQVDINEHSKEKHCDVSIEVADIIIEETTTDDKMIFIPNQNSDQNERVLTVLQPLLTDQSYAAMEAESNMDQLNSFSGQDIFSLGTI